MTALASLRNLTVAYGRGPAGATALGDVTLEIMRGERLAVIGESGSGKSTLALALAGLLPGAAHVSGRIAWPGLDHPPVAGRDIGFVFQDPGNSLNPVLRIGEQIAEVVRRHRGVAWPEAHRIAVDLAARVRLPEPSVIVRAYPHQLSGGQRQRVAIAAAIAGEPALLIADEPTSALDTIVQAEIVTLLGDLVRDAGMTLLFVTHDIALASGFADRIAVLRDGRLTEIGATASVIRSPREETTRRLIASHIDLTTPPLIGSPA